MADEKAVNLGRTAEQGGFKATQLNTKPDAPMDSSWRNKAATISEAAANSKIYDQKLEKDNREDEILRNSYSKIKEILGEDINKGFGGTGGSNKRQQQPSRNQTMSLAELSEGLDETMLGLENDFEDVSSQQPEGSWIVEAFKAKTKSGKIIPVWQVSDSVSKMKFPTPFRIEEVADRIAAILNKSGNLNDPQLKAVMKLYENRETLLKKIRQAKAQLAEGKNTKPIIRQLTEQLQGIDHKLGIF